MAGSACTNCTAPSRLSPQKPEAPPMRIIFLGIMSPVRQPCPDALCHCYIDKLIPFSRETLDASLAADWALFFARAHPVPRHDARLCGAGDHALRERVGRGGHFSSGALQARGTTGHHRHGLSGRLGRHALRCVPHLDCQRGIRALGLRRRGGVHELAHHRAAAHPSPRQRGIAKALHPAGACR